MKLLHSGFGHILALLTVIIVVSCGGTGTSASSDSDSGDDSAATPQLTTIGDLPRATSPVSSSTQSISLNNPVLSASLGMGLADTTVDDFDSNSSLAACHMFNMSKQAISSAATGDLILCYIQSTMEAFAANSDSGIDIYDGEYHNFDLDFSGFQEEGCEGDDCGGGPDKIRFKIVKDDAGVITQFEMYSCSSSTQDMYLKQTISNSEFSMTVKQSGGFNDNTYSDHITVTGTLNSNGTFTGTKNINMNMSHSWGDGGDFWGVMNFAQGASSASMSGYMNGSNVWQSETFTWTDRITGEMQLIDSNSDGSDYNLGLLALGDGAVMGESIGSGDMDTWTHSYTEGWNGDTRLVDGEAAASYLSAVADNTLPTATQPTIAFSGDEAYDCTGTSEAVIAFANIGITDFASCSNLELGHQHIDCWHIMGNESEE